jgi:hypothetical protein
MVRTPWSRVRVGTGVAVALNICSDLMGAGGFAVSDFILHEKFARAEHFLLNQNDGIGFSGLCKSNGLI